MYLSRYGIERYQPGPSTDPPTDPADWEASFDGGATWHDAEVIASQPTWLVAGPLVDEVDLGAAIVLPDVITVEPKVRLKSPPEVIVRDGAFPPELGLPPAIRLGAAA